MSIKRDMSVADHPNFLVRMLTPLTAATPTTASPTHARYFSLASLFLTYLRTFLHRQRAG